MKKLFIIAALIIFPVLGFGQIKYDTYSNARFGFSVLYPPELLIPQGESDNGDGQAFVGTGGILKVYGTNMLINGTLLKEYNAIIYARGTEHITYKVYRPKFFVVSGRRNGNIFYQKVVRKPNGTFAVFNFDYNQAQRALYDKAVAQMSASFK